MLSPWLPQVVSMSAGQTEPAACYPWHDHDYDELCLVVESATRIGHAGSALPTAPGTCYLFRHGEQHGYWNTLRQAPVLWVVHYRPDPALELLCPALGGTPADRVWTLDGERCAHYQSLFLRLLSEQEGSHAGQQAAAAAWLRLMLLTLVRWRTGEEAPAATLGADTDVLALWQHLNANIAQADRVVRDLARRFPNYDALRHRFRKAFKASPRTLITRLRIGRAKQLLLAGDAPVAAIAARLGYARQHEFTRAFHREVGCSPTAFRRLPAPH